MAVGCLCESDGSCVDGRGTVAESRADKLDAEMVRSVDTA